MANDITVSKEIVLNAEAGRLRVRHVGIGNREAVVITGDAELSTPVPFRLQSSCLFSESLLSTDCDCALQLHEALKIVCAEGGLLIYLYEEGRGAGLRAKCDAIYLQQTTGCDTASAYHQLHLEPDPREYETAAAILLALLGENAPVELISNNIDRESRLRRAGVNIARRRPLVLTPTERVKTYLIEKARVLGHIVE
jgi:GTP cyclohydrolase II